MHATDTKTSIATLDGVRGMACLLVVFYHLENLHFFPKIHHAGMLGVMLFFSLSGFLMAYHYTPGRISIRYWLSFFIRRFLRIYPAYALCVMLIWACIGTGWLEPVLWYRPFGTSELAKHLQLTMGLGVLWTIQVELQYYLLMPLFAFAVFFIKHPLHKAAAMGVLWAAFIMAYPHYSLNKFKPVSVLPYCSYFIGGMISCFLYHYFQQSRRISPIIWNGLSIACICVMLLCLNDHLHLINSSALMAPWEKGIFFSPLTALMVLSIALSSGWVKRLLSNEHMQYVGTISYSLYLFHTPVILLLLPYKPIIGNLGSCVLVLFFSISLSHWVYRYVEAPCTRAGKVMALSLHKKIG